MCDTCEMCVVEVQIDDNSSKKTTNERNDETNFMLLWLCTICANRGMRQNPKILRVVWYWKLFSPQNRNDFKYLPLIANINSVQCALQHAYLRMQVGTACRGFAIEMGFRKNTHSQSALNSQNEQIDATQNKTVPNDRHRQATTIWEMFYLFELFLFVLSVTVSTSLLFRNND